MGSYIAAQMGQPTLIVCTKQDLMDQWLDALHGLKIDPSLIGRIQGSVCDYKGKMFVLGMIQSLMCLDKYEPAMYQYFGMMVLDEVHMMAADCFIRACQLFPAKLRLGLSATPKRKDGKTSLLHWHIGPTLVHGHIPVMKPKILMRQTGWKIPPMLPYAPGRMMTVYGAMAKSFPRNAEITNFVEAAYKADRRCLVMADTLPHLDALFQAITARGIAGNEIGYYVGGMKKQELDLTKNKKIILGTVKMCATGTDCPAWDSLCLATPHADVKQAVGRVLRALDGKKQPVILDLVDEDKLLRNFSNTRMKQYWAMEAEIVRL
jgi:superfamily II DNA or RNA helicase